jgi:hypothetical protein
MNKGRHLSPDSYDLRKDGKVLAVVQQTLGGWFCYGMGGRVFNTYYEPVPLDEAKKFALKMVKEND